MDPHNVIALPQKKTIPWSVPLEVQQKLLTQPEKNPTNHVALEFAGDYPFNVAAPHSRVNAWWLAEASWLAYSHDAEDVARVFRDRAGMQCELVAVKGAEAYFISGPQFAILTFRGTQ